MHFDTSSAYFKAHFTYEATTKDSTTDIYLNEQYWYPNGYQVYVAVNGGTPVRHHSKRIKKNNTY